MPQAAPGTPRRDVDGKCRMVCFFLIVKPSAPAPSTWALLKSGWYKLHGIGLFNVRRLGTQKSAPGYLEVCDIAN